MDKYSVRKIIALAIMLTYILMSVFEMVFGNRVSESFTNTTIMIVSYYFGKSTALDKTA